jgi:hypothetical protein
LLATTVKGGYYTDESNLDAATSELGKKVMLKNFQKIIFTLIFTAVVSCVAVSAQDTWVSDSTSDSVVTVLLAADGQAHVVGSGFVVRADGHIMAPLSIVRGAREIQIRLRNGETFDKAELVASDERRNIAILRINAVGLQFVPYGTAEETQVGSRMSMLTNTSGQVSVKNNVVLNSVQMADSVPGAGKGYRLLQFGAIDGVNPAGALLVDERGRALGIVTTTAEVKGQNIAVPFSSVTGLIRSLPAHSVVSSVSTQSSTTYPPVQTPYPIPQSSVLVPQRGVTPLSPKGPGSVVVKPTTVPEILAVSRTIYVRSNSVSFKPEHLINALNKRPEMAEWNLTFTNERELADLILEIDHVVMTWKYTFKIYSERLGTIVATGSKVILDGSVGAPDMAQRVIEKLKVARGTTGKTPNVAPKETK